VSNYYNGIQDNEASSEARVTVLSNGVRVATIKKPVLTTLVSVFNDVGARYETLEENGISHFLEHMAFKGTTTRSTKDISFAVERVGADFNAFTSREMTAYQIVGLGEHVDLSLEILADVMKNSVLDADEIALEQEVVCQEIAESNDDVQDIAHSGLMTAAYPDQSIGRTILGPEENVRSFDAAKIREYMDRHYRGDRMLVLAVGDVDHDAFVATATLHYSDIPAGKSAIANTPTYVGGVSINQDDRFDQAQLMVAFPAPGTEDDDFVVYDLLSDILSSGASSPLFQEVREKRALCYSVGSFMAPASDESLFMLAGSCTPNNVVEFISTACTELAKIAAGEITDEDWFRARNQVKRQAVTMSENTSRTARKVASDLFRRGRTVPSAELVASYMAVTKEQVIAAAKALTSTATPTISIAGNCPKADYAAVVAAAL
jgi:predicted Zn-dependent peptidase